MENKINDLAKAAEVKTTSFLDIEVRVKLWAVLTGFLWIAVSLIGLWYGIVEPLKSENGNLKSSNAEKDKLQKLTADSIATHKKNDVLIVIKAAKWDSVQSQVKNDFAPIFKRDANMSRKESINRFKSGK